MKKKLRNIVVDGAAYRWNFNPAYIVVGERDYRCYDTFIAYAEDNHTSPLRITFKTWEHWATGGPLRYGGPVFLDDPNTGGVNLHTPKWAATLIRAGLKRGWQADARSVPFTIENGVGLLTEMNYSADSAAPEPAFAE